MRKVSDFLQSPALVELMRPKERDQLSGLTKGESDFLLDDLVTSVLVLALRENQDTAGPPFTIGFARRTPNTRVLLAANTIKLHAQPPV